MPVRLLKTTNANSANISPTVLKKGWTYEAIFLTFWNFDGEHHLSLNNQAFVFLKASTQTLI